MIEGIRRRFGKAPPNDSWNSDQELKPDMEEEAGVSTDAPVSAVLSYPTGRYAPDSAGTPDYYTSLVQTALEKGGRFGDHSISISWLRMIRAGLELKQIELGMMWYGVEAGELEREAKGESPSYGDLFRSNRDALAALR